MNTQRISDELDVAVRKVSPSIRLTTFPDPIIENTVTVQVHDVDALELIQFIEANVARPQVENPLQGKLF